MKRITLAIIMSAVLFMLAASNAYAATLSLSVAPRSAVFSSSPKINFVTRMSRTSKVTVRLYSGTKLIRTVAHPTAGSYLSVPWNLRTTGGTWVKPGTYNYTVTAVSGSLVARSRGKVTVPKPPAVNRFFGAYEHGAPDSMAPVVGLESKVGTFTDVVNFYVADSENFPINRATSIREHGSTPMITWEFWSTKGVGVNSIANGSKDAYLRSFARQAKGFGTTVWLRPFHEMNGNWYPWCGTVGPNSPAQVVAAYRHVHDIFVEEGVTNVKFVWCPNNESIPNTSANAIAPYWPGDAYVDYLALDGYNFGTSYSWSKWRSFAATFKSSYATVTGLSAKPLFIAETGSSTQGGNKPAWVNDMFAMIPYAFPRIVGVVWFDTNAECDWRVDSCSSTLSAFRSRLATF